MQGRTNKSVVSVLEGSCVMALLLLACLTIGTQGQSYKLKDEYTGDTFFDGFTFVNWTNGCGQAVNYSEAKSSGLINVFSNSSIYIGVDHTNKYSEAEGFCRKTVQIQSKKMYNESLLILQAQHAPYGMTNLFKILVFPFCMQQLST